MPKRTAAPKPPKAAPKPTSADVGTNPLGGLREDMARVVGAKQFDELSELLRNAEHAPHGAMASILRDGLKRIAELRATLSV